MGHKFLFLLDTLGNGFKLYRVFIKHQFAQIHHVFSWKVLLWASGKALVVFHHLSEFRLKLLGLKWQRQGLFFLLAFRFSGEILRFLAKRFFVHVAFKGIQLVLELSIFFFEFANKLIFFLVVVLVIFLNVEEFDVFLIKLNFLIGLEFLFFELLDDSLNLMILDAHEFKLFFIELNLCQQFFIFLFLQLFVLIEWLILSFQTVVLLDEFLVGFLKLFVFVVNVLDGSYFFLSLFKLSLQGSMLLLKFGVLFTESLVFLLKSLCLFFELIDKRLGLSLELQVLFLKNVALDNFGFILDYVVV